ncbi:MAG TPA: hypothetical protein VIJ86_04560 [Acidimicrobiales bacterium]
MNNKPEGLDSLLPNINCCSPFEDTAIREVPPSAKSPTTYFYVITRRSVSLTVQKLRG